jgi:hypothetical protein
MSRMVSIPYVCFLLLWMCTLPIIAFKTPGYSLARQIKSDKMSAQCPFQSRVGRNGIVLIPSNLVKHRVHALVNPSRSCLKSTMSDATVHQELPWQFDLTDSAIKAEVTMLCFQGRTKGQLTSLFTACSKAADGWVCHH